jgi:hypothetical protein
MTTASLLTLLAGVPAAVAADFGGPLFLPGSLPAVSTLNGKAAVFAGSIDDLMAWGIVGSVSAPLDRQFGVQADGLFGTAGGGTFWGLAGHAFWRNPTQALLGVYGSWLDWSPIGMEVTKVGIEGELYSGPFSFEGLLAMQGGDASGLAGNVTVAFYAQENFRLDASFRMLEGVGSFWGLGAEWQHDRTGLALFGSGNWGADGYSAILGGVRFYAGPPKSLVRRHREDDPQVILPWDLHQLPPVSVPCGNETLILCEPVG